MRQSIYHYGLLVWNRLDNRISKLQMNQNNAVQTF